MRFDLDDAYKYKNRPFHSATPLFHAPNLLLFLNYFSRTVEDGSNINSLSSQSYLRRGSVFSWDKIFIKTFC